MKSTSIWATNGGVYLGIAEDGEELPYVGDRHLTLWGGNGSGKSRRALAVNLERLTGWSILVVDPKGDLCRMTAEHRRNNGSEIIILDPFGATGMPSTGFNPIAAMPNDDDLADDAMEQAEANIRIQGREPHFSQGAQDLFAALTMFVRLEMENGTYGDVRALLGRSDQDFTRMINNREFSYKDTPYLGLLTAAERYGWEEMAIKAARFGDMTAENRELHSIISTALTQTRWLDSRAIKADLSGPALDFSTMKRKPTTVYLCLPARRLSTHSTWLRLMIASILQKLLKDTARAQVPVMFMLDEYFAIAEGDGLPVVSRNMALMRGFSIKLWTVLQDLPQLKTVNPDQWESFIANAGIVQSFAAQDMTTSQYLSDMSGQDTGQSVSSTVSRSVSVAQPRSSSESTTIAQIPRPLLLPQDIRGLEDGETIIYSHRFKGPQKVRLPYPTELPQMRAIMQLDPSVQVSVPSNIEAWTELR